MGMTWEFYEWLNVKNKRVELLVNYINYVTTPTKSIDISV